MVEFQMQGREPPKAKAKAFYARLSALKIPVSRWQDGRPGCWDVDHLLPVVEGGGSCGLDNLRTLCLRCHHQQTQQLRRRRSMRKKRKRHGSHELF
jgi:5-methylcytosine-specific restriction endonuclease McrA